MNAMSLQVGMLANATFGDARTVKGRGRAQLIQEEVGTDHGRVVTSNWGGQVALVVGFKMDWVCGETLVGLV